MARGEKGVILGEGLLRRFAGIRSVCYNYCRIDYLAKGQIEMLNHAKTDINHQTAKDAYRAISFTPGKRADYVVGSYMAEMDKLVSTFTPFATDDNRASLSADLERYRKIYVAKYTTYLIALSRCMSAMITGPSNFPTARNQKRNDTADKRIQEFLEWQKKALKRLHRDYDPAIIARRPISADDADAIEQLQAKIDEAQEAQDMMKAANKIARKKKMSVEDKIILLRELGMNTAGAIEVMRPDYMGRAGFPSYKLTNNNTNIKRTKSRIAQLNSEAARPEQSDWEMAVNGTPVTVSENRDENRLQLFFNGKPPTEVRATLKSNGFRWAPSQGAWQRQLNDNARLTLERIAQSPELETQPVPGGYVVSKLVGWDDGENDLIGVIRVENPDGSTEDHQATSSQGVDLDEMIKTVVKGLVK